MKKRTILEAMKRNTEYTLSGWSYELIGVSEGVNEDDEKKTTFLRFEVEVGKDFPEKLYRRLRFSVKVIGVGSTKVTQEQLDENDSIYYIAFNNLTISYIDQHGTVYFRADAFEIKEGDD